MVPAVNVSDPVDASVNDVTLWIPVEFVAIVAYPSMVAGIPFVPE